MLEFLLEEMQPNEVKKEMEFKTSEGGNVLHFAVVRKSPGCLGLLIPSMAKRMNETDEKG